MDLANLSLSIDVIFEIFQRCDPETQYTIATKIFRNHKQICATKIPDRYRFNITDNILELFPNLTELNISYTSKLSFEAMGKLKRLRKLDISKNGAAACYFLNQGIDILKSITSLNISENTLDSDDRDILRGLSQLTELNIFGYSEFDRDFISKMTKLKKLRARWGFSHVDLPELDNLEYLSISMPVNNSRLSISKKIRVLDIQNEYPDGSIIWDEIKKLTNLECLKLHVIEYNTNFMSNMKYLKYLHVDKYPIQASDIPTQIKYTLKYLSVLDMSLLTLPNDSKEYLFPNLIYLECVSPGEKDISKISSKIKYLNIGEYQDVKNYPIISRPESIEYLKLDYIMCIKLLYFSEDLRIMAGIIPSEFLKNLKYLDLSDISSFAPHFRYSDVPNLEYLFIRSNDTCVMDISKLEKLKFLHISRCYGVNFDMLSPLKSLEALIWIHNTLKSGTDVDTIINRLPKLKWYYIQNPMRASNILGNTSGKDGVSDISTVYFKENGEDLRIMNGYIPHEFDI